MQTESQVDRVLRLLHEGRKAYKTANANEPSKLYCSAEMFSQIVRSFPDAKEDFLPPVKAHSFGYQPLNIFIDTNLGLEELKFAD